MRAREFTEPGAAGCILYAEDTGRWGLQQRSDTVGDPGLWAAWGGGREPGESLEQTVRRELAEESGYTGPIKLEPLARNAKYVTYIGIVPHEFEPRANDEWKDYCWVELGRWPSPMHPGVAAALENVYIKENLAEAFNQPYPMTWEQGEGSYDALVKLPDGTNLSIMFNQDYGDYGTDEWAVEFWRNNSQDVTGEGDAQRIFATVLSAIQHFIQEQHPDRIRFSATKEDDSGNPNQSRSSLYTKLVKRYANAWGYSVDISDYAGTVVYELTNNLNENFADGKVKGKSRPGRVKRSGASCDGSVSSLRAKAKKYGGERGRMYHWCANMKGGKKK